VLYFFQSCPKFLERKGWGSASSASEDNYSISQSDLYQMLAYAVRFKITSVILLYPDTISGRKLVNKIATYEILDEFSNQKVTIKILLADIKVWDSLNESDSLDLNLIECLEETME